MPSMLFFGAPVAWFQFDLFTSRQQRGENPTALELLWASMKRNFTVSLYVPLTEQLEAGGKPSTWVPPGRLVDLPDTEAFENIIFERKR